MGIEQKSAFESFFIERIQRLTCSVALVALCGSFGLDAMAAEKSVVLRGSSSGEKIVAKSLPNQSSSYVVPAQTHSQPHDSTSAENHDLSGLRKSPSWFVGGELVTGLREGAGFLARNAVDSVLFSHSHDAIADRDVTIELPQQGPLRRSMMHSVGYESGLGSDHASISESISSTLRGSYATRSRLERLNAEKARLHGAVANFLPTVNLTVEAAKSKRDSIIAGPFDQDQVDANVEVTVPIFTSGVNTNTLRQARHVSMAASYSYLAEEQVAALEAVAAHVNLRLNRKIVRSLKKNVVALDKLKVVAERLFAAGDASRTDIAIAQANVERARSEVNVARRTLDETRADYESLTGRKAPNKLSLSKPESLVPGDLESAIETALRNNPNLLAAEHSALASKHNAKIVRGQFGPQVNGFGNFQANLHNTVDPDPDNTWSVGVRMTVPLINFGAVPAIDAARHEAAESEYRALEQGRVLRRQITRQWAAYQSAARRVGILQRQVNAVRTSVDGTRREYEAGFRSISDVLNDQVRLTSAQISLETTRHEKILAAYEIAFATSHEGVQHLALAD